MRYVKDETKIGICIGTLPLSRVITFTAKGEKERKRERESLRNLEE